MTKRLVAMVGLAFGLVSVVFGAGADSTIWDGGGADANWTTVNNWDQNKAPKITGDLTFGTGFGSGTNINLNGNQTVNTLTIDSITNFSFNNNILTLTAGDITRTAASGTTTFNSGIFLGGAAAWDITGGLTVNGIVDDGAGSRLLTKSGTGTLTLNNNNTFNGGLTLSAGTLILGHDNAAGSGTLTLTSGTIQGAGGPRIITNALSIGGNLTFSGSQDLEFTDAFDQSAARIYTVDNTTKFSGAISGGDALTKSGTGTLILSGNNSYGATTISAGTLRIGAGGTAGTLGTGNVTNNAALVFNRSDAITAGNLISGTGSLTQSGAGTLTLTNANTYSGATLISAGALVASNTLALQNSTVNYTNNGGVLTFGRGATAYTLGGLSGNKNLGLTNMGGTAIALTVGKNDANTTYSGALSAGGSLVKTGTGKLILSGANTYSGSTVISNGTLQIGDGGTSGALGAGTVYVEERKTLAFNRTDTTLAPFIVSNTITGVTNSAVPYLVVNSGAVQLGGTGDNAHVVGFVQNGATLILAKESSASVHALGRDSVVYSGGTLQLAGTGGDQIADLRPLQVQNGGVFDLNARNETINTLSLAGTGISSGGALINSSTVATSTLTATSGIILTNNSSMGGAGGISLPSVISGGYGLTKIGAGTLTLSRDNSFTGGVTVASGTLIGTAQNAFGTANNTRTLTVNDGGTLIFDANGIYGNHDSTNVPNLVINAGGTAVNGSTGAGKNNPLNNVTLNGGVLTATGANGGYGSWNVNGTVIATGNSTITNSGGNDQTIMLASGTRSNTTFNVVNAGDVLTIATGIHDGRTSGGVDRATDLTKTGAGTLTLTEANIYSGVTTISAGTLQVGNGGTVGTLGSGRVTNNAALVFNRSDAITVGNLISGSGSLTQSGLGTTILTGANSYTNTTTISAGTLQVGNGGTTGTLGTGNVINNSALAFNRNDFFAVNNAIVGTGSLSQQGVGTLVLTGTNTYSGTTTIAGGSELQVGSGTSGLGTQEPGTLGTGAVINNGLLAFRRYGDQIVSNTISGTGSINKQISDSRLTLTATNSTFAGRTEIWAGTLTISSIKSVGGGASSLGAPTTVDNGTIRMSAAPGNPATLAYVGTGDTTDRVIDFYGEGNPTLTQNGSGLLKFTSDFTVSRDTIHTLTLNGSGLGEIAGAIKNGATAETEVTKSGTGAWTLSGTNTYTGVTRIDNGTLQIGNGGTAGTLGTNNVINNSALVFKRSDSITVGNRISGSGSLTQSGAGRLTLSGANTYTNTTTVSRGGLIINGSLQSKQITVNSGGLMGGTGTVQAVTMEAGSILSAGDNSRDTMTFNAALVLSAGSTNIMEIASDSFYDVLKGNGGNPLTANGVFLFDFTGNTTVAKGSTFWVLQNWNWGAVTTNTFTFTVAGLDPNLSLDTSALASTGHVTVIPEPTTVSMVGIGALVSIFIHHLRREAKRR